jgi:predicted dehydrogenase
LLAAALLGAAPGWAEEPLRLGLIGLDTSHVVEFTQILNDPTRPDHVPGARVVAAFKGGSPDVTASATRIDRFTAEVTGKWGVELVDTIEGLCTRVDAVLLTSVDGRKHLAQARPVLKAHRRVFIDKPLAGGFREAREIVRLSRETGTPFFSCSSQRFLPELTVLKANPALGTLMGASTHGPCPIETYVPDLFWYGIHAVEMLYALMGPGCDTVARVHAPAADVVVGRWKGRPHRGDARRPGRAVRVRGGGLREQVHPVPGRPPSRRGSRAGRAFDLCRDAEGRARLLPHGRASGGARGDARDHGLHGGGGPEQGA